MPQFQRTTAIVYRQSPELEYTFLGTAFAFRRDGAFLTAAHCVIGREPNEIVLASPALSQSGVGGVASIVTHESADVAVIKVKGAQSHLLDPFYILSSNHSPGSEVGAWGYPEDISPEHGLIPIPRFFKGHIQRLFQHESHLDFAYPAGELNFGAPAGLSGGPVFTLAGGGIHLAGVVSENFDSTTFLYSVEEFEDEDGRLRESIHRVISYAVFVDLHPLSRWLDEEAGRELG